MSLWISSLIPLMGHHVGGTFAMLLTSLNDGIFLFFFILYLQSNESNGSIETGSVLGPWIYYLSYRKSLLFLRDIFLCK